MPSYFLIALPLVAFTELPEKKSISQRSSCLRTGAYLVIDKIIKETGLRDILGKFMDDKDLGLFLDLAAYSIVSENNAGQYYPDFAFTHPLFSNKMTIYSDIKVCRLLKSMTKDQCIGFLELTNWSGTVERLGDFPRKAFGFALALQIAGCEVDADSNRIIIPNSCSFIYRLPRLADAQHQLRLVMDFLAEVGIREGLACRQQSRFGLHEKHRLGRQIVVQFLDMSQIIASYADDFHTLVISLVFHPYAT